MKGRLLLPILLHCAAALGGQSFEGILRYKVDLELAEPLKKKGITREMVLQKITVESPWAEEIEIAYKGGNYRTTMITNPLTWSIYKGETNRIFTMNNGMGADLCAVTDASLDLDAAGFQLSKRNQIVKIGQYTCQVVRLTWKTVVYDYYFSPAHFKADPDLYDRHTFEGWNAYLRAARALPIRIIKTTPGVLSITLTLVEGRAEQVPDSLFELPELVTDPTLEVAKTATRTLFRIRKN
jgi:hypothetical protein